MERMYTTQSKTCFWLYHLTSDIQEAPEHHRHCRNSFPRRHPSWCIFLKGPPIQQTNRWMRTNRIPSVPSIFSKRTKYRIKLFYFTNPRCVCLKIGSSQTSHFWNALENGVYPIFRIFKHTHDDVVKFWPETPTSSDKNHGFNCKLSHQSIRLFVHRDPFLAHFSWNLGHTHTQYHPIRSSNKTRAKSWRKIPTFLLHSGQWIDFFTQRIVLLDIFCKPPCWMKQSFREEILCICSRNVVRISDLAWRKSTLW